MVERDPETEEEAKDRISSALETIERSSADFTDANVEKTIGENVAFAGIEKESSDQ